jgi:hypothetical protein
MKVLAVLLISVALFGCVALPPSQTDDICAIFKEKRKWYKEARRAEKRWGSPVASMMAIIHQESRFRADAKPTRSRILWIIPGPRKSDAYGYPQAKDATWDWYRKSRGRRGADRDDFSDAIDFVGWYNVQSNRQNAIALSDIYRLYLAYHEGHNGYRRGTYQQKSTLKKVAGNVAARTDSYQRQLNRCEKSLERGFRLWPF